MVEKYGGFQDSNNQPAWSYLVAEDTTDNLSLLSEESCSSTAVMGGTTIETSQNPIARENTGRRIDDLSKPFQEYTVEGLYPKETRYMKWNGSLKEENAAGLGKQIRISRATHNPNSASEERSGKDDSWLFEEGYKLAGMNSSFCSIGQTGASNASGWTDGLSFESSKHKVPGEFSPSGDYSSGKCAFRKQFCHAQSPVFSDIFPGLISLGSKTAGIPPHLSLFAGSHGDGESLDIAAEEGDNEDWESKTKMPLKDETLMSRMNDSSENRKQVIALESNEISGKFEEGSDTTSSAEGTPSANVPDKLGRSVDENVFVMPECGFHIKKGAQ